ncbi:Steroidogenic acute regulatory protein 1 [Trichostrongylus colubriformis]|uniref:Steroidogenic acute regulatory protein 1 n=1 Tax=Trichostrongylus colubriformis TaxID=6319 RepID=A0AAN8G6K9_TRICO
MVSVSTELPLDADSVMNETWIGVDGLPEWNPNIKFARTLASPTSNFDIIHYGNNDVLIISGRDFVSARIYRNTSTGYIMASRSVRLKECPEQKGKVRAELILAGARFSPHPEKKDTTLVDVVMLADLKGLLPKLLVNQVLGKVMLMDTEENRRHFQRIRDRRDQERREEAVRDRRDVEDDMRERQTSETHMKDRKDQEVDKRDGRDVHTYARVVGDENADAREQDQQAIPRERQEEQAKE